MVKVVDVDEPLDSFLAAAADRQLIDSWGSSRFDFEGRHLNQIIPLSGSTGIYVDVLIAGETIRLAHKSPSPDEVQHIRSLFSVASERDSVDDVSTTTELVTVASEFVESGTVVFRRRGWCRTLSAFEEAIEADWAGFNDSLEERLTLDVEGVRLQIRQLDPGGGELVFVPDVDLKHVDGEVRRRVYGLMLNVANAAAWTSIAASYSRDDLSVQVFLTTESSSGIPIDLDQCDGSLELLEWLNATEDANRPEALRHALRLAVVAGRNSLPDAQAVRQIAEQWRLALSAENAAAVQRAVASAHQEAQKVLRESTDGFADISDRTIKAGNSSILAAIGLVAFSVRNADGLPPAIVIAVALAAGVGLVASACSSISRLGDYERQLENAKARIANEKLTPRENREILIKRIEDYGVRRRAKRVQAVVVTATIAAIIIISVSAFWIVAAGSESGSNLPQAESAE